MTRAKDGTPFEKACPDCKGLGEKDEDCERCYGSRYEIKGGNPVVCGKCSGAGKHKLKCETCDGSGMVVDFFEREYEPEEEN
jgi:DnaJ-class molecular chaperone